MDLSEREVSDIKISLRPLCFALNQRKVYFSEDEVRDSVKCCIAHHVRHLKTLRVEQGSVDPLKILTWFGCDLAEREADSYERLRLILECTIASLNAVLSKETPSRVKPFDADTLKYIRDLAVNEFTGIKDHGIGRNGLFLCFHAAQKSKKRIPS